MGTETVVDTALTEDTGTAADTALAVQNRPAAVPANHKGENLGNTICRLRRKKGVTQETLADFIGVTKASVSKWETGSTLPDIQVLPLLAVFFEVTVDELVVD